MVLFYDIDKYGVGYCFKEDRCNKTDRITKNEIIASRVGLDCCQSWVSHYQKDNGK